MVGIVVSGEPTVLSDRSGLGSGVCLSVCPSVNWPFEISVVPSGGVLIEKQGVLLVADFGFDQFCEGYFLCQNKNNLYGLNLVITSLWD